MLPAGYPGYTYQGLLLETLQKVFPGEHIETNSRKESDIKNPETGKYVELDIILPKHNLCFEFQDLHHYTTAWYSHSPLTKIASNDRLKQEQVNKRGDTLVVVPCWWSGDQLELISTIAFQRPDLADLFNPLASHSISLNPSSGYFKETGIPDVGDLMLASFPPDMNWTDTVSPYNAWWMGEKLDGIRVCWHYRNQQLYTRFGLELNLLPRLLEETLPNIFLDGELWFGRGTFIDSQKIASGSESIDWQHLRFVVFDSAQLKSEGVIRPFELRFNELLDYVFNEHPFVKVTSRLLVHNSGDLLRAVELIISNEGEGIVLRRPNSFYEHGRSLDILKIKASRRDGEGIVLAIEPDGSLVVKLASEKMFTVPRQNIRLSIKAKVGDVVTFSCDSYSAQGTPVNPHVFRIRFDLSWLDLISGAANSSNLSDRDLLYGQGASKSIRHWTLGKRKNQRQFLEEFAVQRDLDPLCAETWYNLPVHLLRATKGGSTIIKHFKGNYRRMLFQLFPDLKLDETKFVQLTIEKRFQSVKNRRELFDSFARLHGFDPLVAKNWYNISAIKLGNLRGILQFYSNSVARAIQHLYPEIGINQSHYPILSWRESKARKRLFLQFAQHHGFDPLIPDNWYSTPNDIILGFKGMKAVLNYYNDHLPTALTALFPNIGLKKDGFSPRVHKNFWQNFKNRKMFMETFAKLSGFNPLVPENWYSISSQDIINMRGSTMLSFYRNSLSKAVIDIFPDIGIKEFMFHRLPRKYWSLMSNRIAYFTNLAKELNFDPLYPDNWYNVKVGQVQKGVLVTYGSLYKALNDTFPSIGLEEHKFRSQYTQLFEDKQNRRAFFERYAQSHNFDPLTPVNWYPVQGLTIWAEPGGRALAALYSGSHSKALIDAFPEIGFNGALFAFPKNYWTDIDNRRKLFIDIANKLGFDPFQTPKKWHSVSRASVMEFKGASRVLSLSGNSVIKAVMSLFPELKFS